MTTKQDPAGFPYSVVEETEPCKHEPEYVTVPDSWTQQYGSIRGGVRKVCKLCNKIL